MQKLIVGIVLGWMACVGTANAALILYQGNVVTGIEGLNIGGTLYDVDFVAAPGDATVWGTPTDASAAVDAIVALLNAAVPVPENITAVINIGNYFAVLFAGANPENAYLGLKGVSWTKFGPTLFTANPGVYASFTAVPLPPAVALLAVGLLGLAVSRRRKTA